jgi:hypothetical protein
MPTKIDRPGEPLSYVAEVAGAVDRTRRRRRHRLIAFAVLGVLGLVLSGVWAVSVVTTGPGTGSSGSASLFVPAAPSGDTSALSDNIANGPDPALSIDFVGRWGSIPIDADGGADPAHYEFFEVDLTAAASTSTFYVEIGVNNTPDNFSAMQLRWVKVNGACSVATLGNPAAAGYAAQTLYVESSDSTVVFSGLVGGGAVAGAGQYCIGIPNTGGATAHDAAGTFLRRADPNDDTFVRPGFFAVLGQHS